MLLVAFVLTGASASAQNSGYKPGVRKTDFAQGEKMFIYNTSLPNNQDRTGFYRYVSGENKVQLVKQKPFASSDKYRYDVNGTSIWTIASVENVGTTGAPVYKMSITNSAGQYLKFDMTYSNDVQYVYVRSWENTASNKRAGVASEAADGTTVANANISDSYSVWTVTNENQSSTWNGNVESVATYGEAHPFAFYTTVAMTEDELTNVQSALATTKTNIVSGIETVLTDCGVSVRLTPITLTETNTTSNAEHNIGKPDGYKTDGAGIAGLIDKTDGQPVLNTYFHSRWAGTVVDGYHYIQVDAGEALSAFAFGYSTRNGANQDPTAFDILGSTDGEEWHKIASIDKETFALKTGAAATYAQRGFVLPSGTTYRYFRFAVTANATGRTYGGYPYFALSDFNFSKVTFSCNESYKQNASVLLNNNLLKQEVDALLAGVNDPESAVLTTARNMVANQFFNQASKQPALPFTVTTDTGNKHNYYIKSGRDDNRGTYYFSLKPWDEGKIHLDNTTSAADNAYRYWYFTRSEMSGAIYIHPVTNPTALIGYTDTSDAPAKLNNTAENRNNKFCYVSHASGHCIRPFNANTYISNNGGVGNDMGFWNGVDGGTTVTFEEAGSLPDNIVDLSAKYMNLRSAFSTLPDASLIGTELNQYNQSQVEKVNSAESMLKSQAGTLTTETIANYLAGATFTTLQMNQPAPNGFYRFRNVGSSKYLTTALNGNSTDNRMNMSENRTSAAIFYLNADNKLVGYDNGLYTQNFSGAGNYGFQDAAGTGVAVSFPNGNTYSEATACYRINCGNRSIYGKNATLDAGGTQAASNTDTGYDWTIEAVTALPLTIGEVGWSTFYAPVPVTIPAEVTAYIAGIDGTTCTLTEVEGTVPANTGLILYMQDGGEVEMTIAESGTTDVTGNALVGGTNTVNRENGYIYYALQRKSGDDTKVGLYPYTTTNGTLKGFRAFYRAASESPEANAAGFSFDTIITGIDGILGTDGTNDGKIYDLSGRRLNKPVKGLNIIGGKKVLVK